MAELDIYTYVNSAFQFMGFGFALESMVILTGHVVFSVLRMFKQG